MTDTDSLQRCGWIKNDPLMRRYHDEEWGVPVHDDRMHFEYLVLDAFQAGLSWAIILKKREGFRRAFAGFDPDKVARYNRRSVERLLRDPAIVRNRQKIDATIANARAFLDLRHREGSFDAFIWRFVDGEPRQNRWRGPAQLPPRTPLSDAMSAALKSRGFRFVGSTICYSYMQAAGMVNDHVVTCFRHDEVARMR
jgi:DNA-3-methyladenine glycosylase I